MRVKQNDDFGPIRIPDDDDFSCPTTAKLPLQVALGEKKLQPAARPTSTQETLMATAAKNVRLSP